MNSYRSIWVSDFHLGTRRCQAHTLLDFLRQHQAQTLYLVGDIVDGWNIGPSWYWNSQQDAVVREIAAWRKRGTRVELLPGNHDERNTDLIETLFGIVPNRAELIHRTAEGRRFLILHGHQFDGAIASGRWLKGSQAYPMALRLNNWYAGDLIERDTSRRSISTYLRHRLKKTVQYLTYVDDRAVLEAARRQHVDGVICGHIHRAEQRLIDSIWYINDGDWVGSCTALAESLDGRLHLLRWKQNETEANENSTISPDEENSYGIG